MDQWDGADFDLTKVEVSLIPFHVALLGYMIFVALPIKLLGVLAQRAFGKSQLWCHCVFPSVSLDRCNSEWNPLSFPIVLDKGTYSAESCRSFSGSCYAWRLSRFETYLHAHRYRATSLRQSGCCCTSGLTTDRCTTCGQIGATTCSTTGTNTCGAACTTCGTTCSCGTCCCTSPTSTCT